VRALVRADQAVADTAVLPYVPVIRYMSRARSSRAPRGGGRLLGAGAADEKRAQIVALPSPAAESWERPKLLVRLVVIDPVAAHLSVSVYNEQDVRRALSPLRNLAEESRASQSPAQGPWASFPFELEPIVREVGSKPACAFSRGWDR
jgi:hypothetical protein